MKAIETVTFKLKSAITTQDFLSANRQVDQWVRTQPGFESRYLAQGEDDVWLDCVFWSSLSEAKAAMKKFMQELCESDFLNMIDESTVHALHSQVVSSLP